MKRAVGLLGWLGVVLVLAAVALRFIRPEMQEWVQRLAMAGLVVVVTPMFDSGGASPQRNEPSILAEESASRNRILS